MIFPAMSLPKSSFRVKDKEWKTGESSFKHDQDVLMPGFRFHPTEEELVEFYLRRKVEGKHFNIELIASVDLYRYDPWELPGSISLASIGEKEWFFYVRRDKKYRNGDRPNRVTTSGYWKATGIDRMIRNEVSRCIGLKKTLVFYKGKAPKGKRTSWMMNEYRLPQLETDTIFQKRELSLCRVYKKSGGSEEGRRQPKERHKRAEKHEDPEMHRCQNYMACSNPGTTGQTCDFMIKEGDKDSEHAVRFRACSSPGTTGESCNLDIKEDGKDERLGAHMEQGVLDQSQNIPERIYSDGGNIWSIVNWPITLNEDLEVSLTTSFMCPRATDQLAMAEDLYNNNPSNLIHTNSLTSGACLPTCSDKLWEWNPVRNNGNGASC